ncbi:MAG: chromosome partition protein MukB [Alphaproteobacteria bacterium]|nr:chromosome partition protein MukB [Alphaproteobacteria bacterium]MCB9791231.1 chromosome partition protein MukB [Alphaproteobacteria bacterium]
MTRAAVAGLALVNWKGIVYEHLALDAGVTALEGENGAGKTTVMIAAYCVLLPDLTFLRFTNVGEGGSGDGGRGIHGRLGRAGPSYSWLDIRTPQQRVVAGVHLARMASKRLEVEPILMEDVPEDLPLIDLVMRPGDEGGHLVPDPTDLKALAFEAGADIKLFGGDKKGYFSRLFELGITPLRLATNEERRNLNEMLRTCMMGGISNTLRSGLREFLFSESVRLADTVKRMQENLLRCRRTRAQAERSAKLEAEIRQLYEAGAEAYRLTLQGVVRWEAEAAEDVAKSEAEEAEYERELERLALELERIDQRLASLEAERELAEQRLGTGKARVSLLRDALRLQEKLRACEQELAEAERERLAAEQRREACVARRDEARAEALRARRAHGDAASSLADQQRGFEELDRKVGRFHAATKRLRQAQDLLDLHELGVEDMPDRLRETANRARALQEEHTGLILQLQDHDRHAERFAQGLKAATDILGRALVEASLPEHLPEVDALRRTLLEAQASVGPLREQLRAAQELTQRQERVRASAAALATPSSDALRAAIDDADAQAIEITENLDALREALSEAQLQARELEGRLALERAQVAPWRQAHAAANALALRRGPLATPGEVAALGRDLASQEVTATTELHALRARMAELKERQARLELSGDLPPHVLRARDQVDGSLVADLLEHVSAEDAPEHEALLGPLAQGLVVDNPEAAAAHLSGLLAPGEHLWLLERLPPEESPQRLPDGSLLVRREQALRVSQPTDTPVLGRAAREQAVVRVSAALAEAETQEEARSVHLQELREDRGKVQDLLPLAKLLSTPNPAQQIALLMSEFDKKKQEIDGLRRSISEQRSAQAKLAQRSNKLHGLLADAPLLDPPDHSARLRALTAQKVIAERDAARLRSLESTFERFDALRADLARTPPSAEARETMSCRAEALQDERARLAQAIEALETLMRDPEPLRWGTFVPELEATRALKPKMEEELRLAEERLTRAQAAEDKASEEFDAANQAYTTADGDRIRAQGEQRTVSERLQETGEAGATPQDLESAALTVTRLEDQLRPIQGQMDCLRESRGMRAQERSAIQVRLQSVVDALGQKRREQEQRARHLNTFRQQSEAAGLNPQSVLDASPASGGSGNLFGDARAARKLVRSLLSRGDEDTSLRSLYEEKPEGESSTLAQVAAWQALRANLLGRIPPDISESADVLEGLKQLGRQLHRLNRTLTEQERELRIHAGQIGDTIRANRRRAHNEVRRLSRSLSRVHFGSIQEIQLGLTNIPRMDDLLNNLSGEIELFDEVRPIEEVLEELFTRIGGGRVQADKLLDYRQYFTVDVQVRRAEEERRRASGDEMSTGEAIGVGTSVMMIVLQAWEEHSGRLRQKQGHEPLRFLFLDEATRLSRESLLVLFELCKALELQLLIAAPEVARVEGATTYTLVRQKKGGKVDVHGRRVVARAVE